METKFQLKPVDEPLYQRYMDLKFMAIGGAKLTDEAKAMLAEWEAELKPQHGRKAKRTVRAAIGSQQFLMIEGFPVPASFVTVFREKGCEDYYLQKQD